MARGVRIHGVSIYDLASLRAMREEIHAVHVDDLEAVLESLGLAEMYRSDRLHCWICGQSIRDAGLGTVRIVNGEIRVSCGDLDCGERETGTRC